jgi:hypothetical protein
MLLGVLVGSACLLAACSGGSSTATVKPGAATGTTVHVAKEATDQPSVSAQMVCEPEAVKDIQTVIGIPAKVSKPSWNAETHTFSCNYVYPQGTMTLTVREFDNADETTAYYNQRATDLGGKDQDLQGLGNGGFTTKNGDTVIRKDYKVLTIDTTKLPAQFGAPPDTRANDGINVAATIMGCWTGA